MLEAFFQDLGLHALKLLPGSSKPPVFQINVLNSILDNYLMLIDNISPFEINYSCLFRYLDYAVT